MISCPSCQKQVEILDKHVGTLFSCPHCSSVYYINFEGIPEVAQPEPEIAATVNSGDVQHNYVHQAEESYQVEEHQESAYNYNEYSDATETEEPVAISAPLQNDQQFDQAYTQVDRYDFEQPLDQVSMGEDVVISSSDSPDFADVVDFGNADTGVGPLTYAVVIEGIDSAQVIHDIKEAMYDSKFGWDVNEQMAQVNRGRLVLPGLSPAKAFVLINRIKYLPLKISWRQDVLSSP